MKRLNKNIGAKVQVNSITVEINPKVKWKKLKKVTGTIVKNKGYEHYWHTCSGGHIHVNKHLIENDCFPNFAVKLDNNIKDIEGNNIIIVREFDLKFLERIEIPKKPITEKTYLSAKKVIEKYEKDNKKVKTKQFDNPIARLRSIFSTMKVSNYETDSKILYNLEWFYRNLHVHNRRHKDYIEAIDIIEEISSKV